MLMTRWQPLSDLWNQLAHNRNGLEGWRPFAARTPALCLWEENDTLYAEAELPGMEIEDITLYVNGNNELRIEGERKLPADDNGTWHRRERGYGRFSRTVTLPFDVAADKVEASLHNGILTVAMPKNEEAKPKRIEVKVR